MQDFIARMNIAHYQQLLKREQDPAQRKRLETMLAEEQGNIRLAEERAGRAGSVPDGRSTK